MRIFGKLLEVILVMRGNVGLQIQFFFGMYVGCLVYLLGNIFLEGGLFVMFMVVFVCYVEKVFRE